MDFGVVLASPADAWRHIKRAEDAGYASAWVFDTQLLTADPFVSLAAAAVKTQRIRLGTGVLIPSNRIVPVAANAFASLNQLAPGRIQAGIGTGFTGRLTMGLGPCKLGDLRGYVEAMQGLWNGDTVTITIDGLERPIRFLSPEAGMINVDDRISVHVSAMGPRSRRLTAETGADWIFVDYTPGFGGSRAAAEAMDAAYRDAGVDPATRRKTMFLWGSVLRPGEDASDPRVVAESGPFAANMLHAVMEAMDSGADASGGAESSAEADGSPLGLAAQGFRATYEGYGPIGQRYLDVHRGHLLYVREDERRHVTGDLIRATTQTATADVLREGLREVRDAGFDEVVVAITPGFEDAIDDWMAVLATV